jgi:deazaflavin-dependent oxidoreductase (nitroreductase family)
VPSEKRPEQFLYLTTRGRKTGLPREIEIWFAAHDQKYYVMAEYATSHWLQNLRADPRVKLRVHEQTLSARARILSSETETELSQAIRDLFKQKYGWGEGLPVELIPESGN